MKWHVICSVGPNEYCPSLPSKEGRLRISLLNPGSPQRMKENVLQNIINSIGSLPSDICIDFLHLAMSVQAADTCILRTYGTDGWTRDITVHLPVTNMRLWRSAKSLIEEMLKYLSGDDWHLILRPCSNHPVPKGQHKPIKSAEVVSLFSGGLDSCVGVIDLLHQGLKAILVGHYRDGTTSSAQNRIGEFLRKTYKDQSEQLSFYVDAPTIVGCQRETTQRARSFLFVALGLSVADAVGLGTPLHIPENGLISLNVPLTEARAGSLSTRTTHPHFASLLRESLAKLNLDHPVELKYRFMTKGELLRDCFDQSLLKKIARETMSCAHPDTGRWDGDSPGSHCGYCVPCIVRQAAMTFANIPDCSYRKDILAEPPKATSSKGHDLRGIRMALERFSSENAIRSRFKILSTGSIPASDLDEYIAVYRRGMKELAGFFEKA